MRKQINGFTLIEMLFTLMVLATLLLLVVPNIIKTIEKQETKQFFNVLESDVFYIQNQLLGTRRNAYIVFEDDHYVVISSGSSERKERDYPRHLINDSKSKNRVTFSRNGTIIEPKTYIFKDRDTTYKVIFPLGKGRHYVEE